MKQKGLMFSLEVMIAIIILAVAIGVVMTGNNPEIGSGNFVNSINQSERITSVYFNKSYTGTTGELMVCGNYWEYLGGTLLKRNICEGYP